MTTALEFSHPPEVRAKARDALEKHGSYRKAAAAVDIPKSTIAHWQNHGGFDNLDTVEPLAQPTEGTETLIDGKPAEDVNLDPRDPGADEFPENPLDPWIPDSPKCLEALLRYASGLANGTHPARAMHVAQVVDPEFSLTVSQHTRLLQAMTKLQLSERISLARVAPPEYVRSVYDQYAMDENAVSELSGYLLTLSQDAYTVAINDQLTSLGRPTISTVSDPDVLASLRERADAQAAGIAETYNRDLAGEVGTSWLERSAEEGRQMSRAKLGDEIDSWIDDRAEWKAEQWAITEGMGARRDALMEFATQNPDIVEYARIEPQTASCDACRDAVEAGVLPVAEIEALEYDHPNCQHGPEPVLPESIPADQELWTAQDDASASEVA